MWRKYAQKMKCMCLRWVNLARLLLPIVTNTLVWVFSFAYLREAQSKDNDLCFIKDWLNSSAVPGEGALFSYSPAASGFV